MIHVVFSRLTFSRRYLLSATMVVCTACAHARPLLTSPLPVAVVAQERNLDSLQFTAVLEYLLADSVNVRYRTLVNPFPLSNAAATTETTEIDSSGSGRRLADARMGVLRSLQIDSVSVVTNGKCPLSLRPAGEPRPFCPHTREQKVVVSRAYIGRFGINMRDSSITNQTLVRVLIVALDPNMAIYSALDYSLKETDGEWKVVAHRLVYISF